MRRHVSETLSPQPVIQSLRPRVEGVRGPRRLESPEFNNPASLLMTTGRIRAVRMKPLIAGDALLILGANLPMSKVQVFSGFRVLGCCGAWDLRFGRPEFGVVVQLFQVGDGEGLSWSAGISCHVAGVPFPGVPASSGLFRVSRLPKP